MAVPPRIYRPLAPDRIQLRMPYDPANRRWLHQTLGDRIQPVWDKPGRRWLIARAHFGVLVDALVDRFGVVDVDAEFSTAQKCDRRCMEATGDDCECSCMGEHHGGGIWFGWVEVGDTTLIRPDRMLRRMRLVGR